MSERLWGEVEAYFARSLASPAGPSAEASREASRRAGLPDISVTPAEGRLLHLAARAMGARQVLEVGTLGGYSAIWLASALPEDGRLVTIELDAGRAEVARESLRAAGLLGRVDLRVGDAREVLPRLVDEGRVPFDLVFIDADKASTAVYASWALRLTRPGGVIVIDNVVRGGRVLEEGGDANVRGVREAVALLSGDPRVRATAIQTVGSKGYDGFLVAMVGA